MTRGYDGGWSELEPFWEELVPEKSARVLLPGVGNDQAMVEMFDAGWSNVCAFDYAAAGVERSRALFGERAVELLVADARELPFAENSFDAALEKGALDSIFLAGDGDTMEMMQAVLDTKFWLATHVTTVTLGLQSMLQFFLSVIP